MLKPRPVSEEFEAVCDIAVMIPAARPTFVDGDSAPYELIRVANVNATPHSSPFAAVGYLKASDRNVVDYEARTLTFAPHLAIGTYNGASPFKGHHILDVSTKEFGGPNGLSGGPVFRLLFDDESESLRPSFAGIVTTGGPERIHFVDVAYLSGSLLREVFRHSPTAGAQK